MSPSAIIRVQCIDTDKFRHCKINLSDFNKESFLNDVMPVVRIEKADQFKIFDNLGAEIPFALLEDIIIKYERGENFILRIEVEKHAGKAPNHQLVVTKELKKFFIQKNFKHLIQKSADNIILNEKERFQVIKATVTLLIKNYGLHPESNHKNVYADALHNIFPQWARIKIYGKNSGWMYNRLRNERLRANIKCDQNGNSSDVQDFDEAVENESNTVKVTEDDCSANLGFQEEDYLDLSPDQDDNIEYDISGSDSSSVQQC